MSDQQFERLLKELQATTSAVRATAGLLVGVCIILGLIAGKINMLLEIAAK